jgi:starch synthase (maltosyl-transferring)
VNRIRKENRALQFYDNLHFYRADNPAILCYAKTTDARDNMIVIVVNLDPVRSQNSYVHIPLTDFGPMDSDVYEVHDLLTDARYLWRGDRNYVELDPELQPAHIFRVRRWLVGEKFL